MNSRVKDDLVQSLKSFLPFEVVNPNPSNRYDKLLTYIKESDVPDNVNLFYPDKLALVGNLGIGTRNPVRGLHLEGDSGTSAIRFKTTGGEWDFAPFWSAFDDGNFALNRVSGSGNILIPSGNVGIGLDNPSQLLHLSGAPATGGIRIDEESNTAYQAYLTFLDTSGNFGLDVNGGGRLRFATGGSENLTILSSGDVGIGVSNPIARLEVVDTNNEILLLKQTAGPASYMTIGPNNNTGAKIGYDNTDSADLATIGHHTVGNVININSLGNVGIGVNPQARLHVAGDNDTEVIRVGGAGDAGGVQGSAYIGISPWKPTSVQTYSPIRIGAKEVTIADYRADLIFETREATSDSAPVERMRIRYNGNVGIGEPSPDTKLHISGSGNVAGKVVSTDAAAVWVADSISTEASILSFTTAGANAWNLRKAATTGNLEIRNSTDATKFTMLDSGNVGLGIVPNDSWSSTYAVLQIGQDVALWGAPAGANAALSSNLYYDGGGYKYLNSSRAASQIYLTGGQFGIQSAASGTAGQAASLATRLHMTNTGSFFINAGSLATTDSTANLNIATGGSAGGLKLIAGFTPGNGNDLGAITFAGNDSANNNSIGEASITAKAMGAHSGTTAPAALLFSTKPSSLGPGSSPIERMRIDDEGRVGIGPSSDYNQGKIWASAHITDHNDNSVDRSKGLRFGTHEATLQSAGIACWNFNTGGSPYYRSLTFYATGYDGTVTTRNIMTIGHYGGNVGIWEENPSYRLDIVHSGNSATYPIRIGNRDTTAGTNQQVGVLFSLARNSGTILDGGSILVSRSSDMTNDDVNIDTHMSFYTQNNYSFGEKMRITNVGNVSVNDAYITNFVNNGSNTRYIGVAAAQSDALFIAHSWGQGVGYFGYDYSADRLIIATDNGSGGNSIQFSVNAGTTTDGGTDNLASATAAMAIDSSGNIGVNTDAPSFSTIDGYGQLGIHIKGEKDSNQSPVIRLEETGSLYGAFEIRSNRVGISSGNILTIGEGADAFLTLQADESGGSTARRGYIGIGTTNPLQKLDVRGYASLLQGAGWGTTWTSTPASPLYVGIGDDSTFNSGIAAIHAENKGNRGNIANSIGSDLLRLEYNDRDGILYNRYGAFQIGNFTARSVTTGDDLMMMQLEGIPRWNGTDWSEWPGIQIIANNPSSGGGALYLAHARGSTIGSNTTLLDGDSLGVVGFSGANGTDIQTGATMYATANGDWSGTNQGADIIFQTTANGSTAYPSERLRILSSGGITFNGDTATANALDDYEEGTWTPVLTFNAFAPTSVTYLHRKAGYIKIGGFVFLTLDFYVSGYSGGSGSLQITGLPYVPTTTDGRGTLSGRPLFGVTYAGSLGWELNNNSIYATSGANYLSNTEFATSGFWIMVSGCYKIV